MSQIFSKTEPLMTAAEFRKRYCFGVDLRDGDGNIFADEVIEKYISQAIDWLEHELNVTLYQTEKTEYVDYMYANYRQWCFVQLPLYPVIDVSLVELHFADDMKVTFPASWYKVYHTSGQVQFLPTMSTLSAVIIAQTGQLLPRAVRGEYAPQLVKVTYTAGFDFDKLPPLINETIALKALQLILNMLGDIGQLGPGIASTSMSMDGLSQSTQTAISPTNALYGARMLNNQKFLQDNLKVLKRKYKRIGLAYI